MPLLKDCPEELTDEEWIIIKRSISEHTEGRFYTEEEVRAQLDIE